MGKIIKIVPMKFKCKVITRASKNEIVGLENLNTLNLDFKKGGNAKDNLPDIKVYLTAVPIKGRANKELIELLSEKLNVARSKISIIRGEKNKEKIIEVND